MKNLIWLIILFAEFQCTLKIKLHLGLHSLQYPQYFSCVCSRLSRLPGEQEPTQALPPPKTRTAQASASSIPKVESRKSSEAASSPSMALLRLLQTAFNRQTPGLQQQLQLPARASSVQRKQQQKQPGHTPSATATRLPPQSLYQALDMINKYQGTEDNVYSDYTDGFYSTKPYRHRDDRLLQALFEMLGDDRK